MCGVLGGGPWLLTNAVSGVRRSGCLEFSVGCRSGYDGWHKTSGSVVCTMQCCKLKGKSQLLKAGPSGPKLKWAQTQVCRTRQTQKGPLGSSCERIVNYMPLRISSIRRELGSRWATLTMQRVVGEPLGVQIGNACWELFCLEHGIQLCRLG